MARIRTIKPDFFRHEELYQAEIETGFPLRVAFAGMFTVADREGRFRWKPKQIKIDVMPWDDLDFNLVLDTLTERGFIKKYIVDGKSYGWIPSFKDHQAINNKESKSTLPQYSRDADASFTRLSRDGNASLTEGKGREGKEHKRVGESLCSVFGKHYKTPDERMLAEANFYRDIDTQVELLLQVHKPEKVIEQVAAYIKHCYNTDRKLIGTAYKLSETILSSDWIALNDPEGSAARLRARDDPYTEERYNLTQWTTEAWLARYSNKLKSDSEFSKIFNPILNEKLRSSTTVGR